MKSLWEERTARISEARLNSKAIGEELKELREWMRDPEGRLGRPVSVHDTSEKEFKKKRKEYQVSQMLSVGFVQPRRLAYRVSHLLVDLGWVGYFECSTVCPILLGLVEIWQKRLGSWTRWWNIQIKVNPNQVHEQIRHPVQ